MYAFFYQPSNEHEISFETYAAGANIAPSYLRCEYLVDPLGIGVVQPRLSWTLEPVRPDLRGTGQTAYQILAATRPEILAGDRGDLWDTGKVPKERLSIWR